MNTIIVPELPFVVPPFEAPSVPTQFVWWSWHPLYAYWSKSCWSATTQEGAMALLERLGGNYCNVLVRECYHGCEVVHQDGPRRPAIWWKIWYQFRSGHREISPGDIQKIPEIPGAPETYEGWLEQNPQHADNETLS